MLTRVARSLWAADIEPGLRPVLVVSLLFTAPFSTFWGFVGILALERLDAGNGSIGVLFMLAFTAGLVSAYLGGQISDRVGRKPVIVAAIAGQSLVGLALLPVDTVAVGLALIVLAAAAGAPVQSANNALVADLVEEDAREKAYAAVRVAQNVGVALGPPIGGLLLFVGGWTAFLLGVTALGSIACIAALRLLPVVPMRPEAGASTRENLSRIARDLPFVLLLLSTFLGFLVYVAWETVLPVVAVDSFGLSPAAWGPLLTVNAALVALFQLRLTRAVDNVSDGAKLAVAMPLMGLSFLLFLADTSLAALVVVAVTFVVGEMLWIPTAQSLAARLAPQAVRGAYMGAYGAAAGAAWTIGPLLALQIRTTSGDTAVWLFFAAVSAAGAFAGVLAGRRAGRQPLKFLASSET